MSPRHLSAGDERNYYDSKFDRFNAHDRYNMHVKVAGMRGALACLWVEPFARDGFASSRSH